MAPLRSSIWKKHIALPQQHGSWILWLGPLAIGVAVGGEADLSLIYLAVTLLGAFLAIQPLTILVKVLSQRRSRGDLASALCWLALWSSLAALGSIGLVEAGKGQLILLGLPGVPVLAWQMYLVSRRSERGQMGVEIVGSGILALAAPAGFWAAGGEGPIGWWLWILCWLQAAGAVVYIYLRLQYRRMDHMPRWRDRIRLARRSNLYHGTNLAVVSILAFADLLPLRILVPFAAMLLEAVLGGILHPSVGSRPSAIGMRQVALTLLFVLLMIWAFQIGAG
jgi:hypothetical protein